MDHSENNRPFFPSSPRRFVASSLHSSVPSYLRIFAPLLLLLTTPRLLADTVRTAKQDYPNCRIVGVETGSLVYEIAGQRQSQPLADVSGILVDAEPSLSAAEDLLAKQDWDRALTQFDRAARSSNQPWVRDWSNRRTVEAAQKAGRFDSAIRGLIQLAQDNPAEAAKLKLTPPRADSAYLPEAITAVDAALGRLADARAQEVLARLLVELHQMRGDKPAADKATLRLAEIQVKAYPNSPEALTRLLSLKIAGIDADLQAGRFDQVITQIASLAPSIDDPADQVKLLWMLAEARRGLAGNSGNAEPWKEVAAAYLRVVAAGPKDNPLVPDALLKVAEIHAQRLNDKSAARKILQRMIEQDYPQRESAAKAQKMLEGL
jgi:hypothetical protein